VLWWSWSLASLWNRVRKHDNTQIVAENGEVATSTHAGLPWLLFLREKCRRPSHFWPFDGWEIPEGKSVVAEVYPSLWTRRFPRDDRDGDEQAANAAAAWLRRADRTGSLTRLTYAFSKKKENLRAALALHFWFYNFARIHGSLRVTPGMESGVVDRIWTIQDLLSE
jgi:hypothetical protein